MSASPVSSSSKPKANPKILPSTLVDAVAAGMAPSSVLITKSFAFDHDFFQTYIYNKAGNNYDLFNAIAYNLETQFKLFSEFETRYEQWPYYEELIPCFLGPGAKLLGGGKVLSLPLPLMLKETGLTPKTAYIHPSSPWICLTMMVLKTLYDSGEQDVFNNFLKSRLLDQFICKATDKDYKFYRPSTIGEHLSVYMLVLKNKLNDKLLVQLIAHLLYFTISNSLFEPPLPMFNCIGRFIAIPFINLLKFLMTTPDPEDKLINLGEYLEGNYHAVAASIRFPDEKLIFNACLLLLRTHIEPRSMRFLLPAEDDKNPIPNEEVPSTEDYEGKIYALFKDYLGLSDEDFIDFPIPYYHCFIPEPHVLPLVYREEYELKEPPIPASGPE
jgi:hypothetical protein